MKKYLLIAFFLSILNAQQIQLLLTRAKLQELAENSLSSKEVPCRELRGVVIEKDSHFKPKDVVQTLRHKFRIIHAVQEKDQIYLYPMLTGMKFLVLTYKTIRKTRLGSLTKTQTFGYVGPEFVNITLKRYEYDSEKIKTCAALLLTTASFVAFQSWY